MSSIFKKLSVILCCLFGLVSINPVTLAKPGDYLVYFLGKDENNVLMLGKDENNVLMCGECHNRLRLRSGQFVCPKHCISCASPCLGNNMWGGLCRCCSSKLDDIHVLDIAYNVSLLLRKYGPFCFINYENGGDVDTVFQNAKKSNQLYCAYCMKKKLNGNFGGKISSNIPEIFKTKSGAEFDETFKLDALSDDAGSASNICNDCNRRIIGHGARALALINGNT